MTTTPFAIDPQALQHTVTEALGALAKRVDLRLGEVTVTVAPADWHAAAQTLRDAPGCQFEQLMDLAGLDYADYGNGGWEGQRYHGDTYARFTLELLDALQVSRFVIAGNSLGGEVAWRTAYAAPQRVAAMVLVDAFGPAFEPESVPLGFVVARTPVLRVVTEWTLPRELVEQSVRSVYGDPARVTPALVDRYYELTLRDGNRAALVERLALMVPGEHAERIGTLRLPTLLLWGGRDRLVPPAVGREFQRLIPGSRLVEFPELGHVPQEEDPARSVAPVLEFLAASAPGAARAPTAAAPRSPP